jgi:hypothetical protein
VQADKLKDGQQTDRFDTGGGFILSLEKLCLLLSFSPALPKQGFIAWNAMCTSNVGLHAMLNVHSVKSWAV